MQCCFGLRNLSIPDRQQRVDMLWHFYIPNSYGKSTRFLHMSWSTLSEENNRISLITLGTHLDLEIFLVSCRFGNGAMISYLWCRDETESLLWQPTQGYAARHALVLMFLVKTHYGTTPMSHLLMNFSLVISPYLVRRSVCWTGCNQTSFWSRPEDNLEEQSLT